MVYTFFQISTVNGFPNKFLPRTKPQKESLKVLRMYNVKSKPQGPTQHNSYKKNFNFIYMSVLEQS